jgi:osmotically-inducible protein OsmY
MTRIHAVILSILSALVLSACGQGNAPAQGSALPRGGTLARGDVSPQSNAGTPPAPQATSDQNVLTKVKSTLDALPGVKSEQISVSVSQGVVTLVGPVDSPEQHQQIVRRVAQVDGVQSVVDDLQPIKGS